MKKIVLMLFAMALTLGASAESVSPEQAMAAADAWAARNGAFGAGQGATNVVTECDAETGVVLWHQVSMAGGGMLVVAPVTEIEPVVMALDNDPGVLPEAHPLKGILRGDMRRRLQFLGLYPQQGAVLAAVAPAASSADGDDAADVAKAWGAACEAKWARLTKAAPLRAKAVGVAAEEIVEVCVVKGFEKKGALTHWNQSSYNGAYLYNLYTPNHAVCGCVATACAALAQFYGTTNAVAGLENDACTYNGKPYKAKTMGGAIDWSILPENWGGTNAPATALTTEQQQLIGRVAYDAGVGVGMMWTDDESGATMGGIVTALKDVFGFRHARSVWLSDEENPAQEELEKLIYNQCRAGVPVGMGIEGHAVVAAGYGLDADGVERVRVFMGWSGSGDGWYALPKIDTQAMVGGGTYLSEVVDEVITMIAYDNDDIVPVVGHVTMPGTPLEIAGLGRTLTSSGEGYFGTRVPADMGTCTVTCQDKVAEIEINAEAADETKTSDELCPLLPNAFEFVLMDCTVAYSLERAKLYALREGKAILRVSGVNGETNTTAVLNIIYNLAKDNVDGFSDRFVYYFAQSSSAAGDGADLSYGVYLPSAVDPADRWQAKNGALAYGYLATVTTVTNVTHDAGHAAETNGLDAVETTRALTYTFAPIDGTPELVTLDAGETDAILEAVSNSLLRVLGVGATRFAECTSGITVTIGATSKAAEAAINATADSAQACGVHANCYTNGPYTFTCDAVVTNQDAGVVLACGGWTATNATTGAVLSGAGHAATLDLAANDAVALTWDFSQTNAVYVTVETTCPNAPLGGCTVTPGSGWYAWGEAALFMAACDEGYMVSNWQFSRAGTGLVLLNPWTYALFADAPGKLWVTFRKGGTMAAEPVSNVLVTATSWLVSGDFASLAPAAAELAPTTTVFSATGPLALASGDTAEVFVVTNGGDAVVQAGARTFIDGEGTTWQLLGFVDGTLDGTEKPEALLDQIRPRAAFTLRELYPALTNACVNWLWMPVGGDPGGEPETAFAIEWDDALSTLNAGYTTNLTTMAALEAHGLALSDLTVTAPKGFRAKVAADAAGNVVATLELDEDVLRPLAEDGARSPLTILANGDGTLTVKADVANGVRGFWYTLYAADELGGTWSPVAAGAGIAGEPSLQAKEDALICPSITLSPTDSPTDAKRFYKLVVTDVNPELPEAP